MLGRSSNEVRDGYRYLVALNDAGFSIELILNFFRETEHPSERRLAREMTILIRRGKSLSQAMALCGLPLYDVALIRAAEETGRLHPAAQTLERYYEIRHEAGRAIAARLVRPGLIILVALFISPIPKLVNGFLSFERYLVQSVGVVAAWVVLTWMTVALERRARRDSGWAALRFRLLSFLPWFGRIARLRDLEAFYRTLAYYQASGYGIPLMLEAAAGVVSDPSLRERARAAVGRVEKGGLAGALALVGGLEPGHLALIATGEASGTLDRALAGLGDVFGSEAESAIYGFLDVFPHVVYFAAVVFALHQMFG